MVNERSSFRFSLRNMNSELSIVSWQARLSRPGEAIRVLSADGAQLYSSPRNTIEIRPWQSTKVINAGSAISVALTADFESGYNPHIDTVLVLSAVSEGGQQQESTCVWANSDLAAAGKFAGLRIDTMPSYPGGLQSIGCPAPAEASVGLSVARAPALIIGTVAGVIISGGIDKIFSLFVDFDSATEAANLEAQAQIQLMEASLSQVSLAVSEIDNQVAAIESLVVLQEYGTVASLLNGLSTALSTVEVRYGRMLSRLAVARAVNATAAAQSSFMTAASDFVASYQQENIDVTLCRIYALVDPSGVSCRGVSYPAVGLSIIDTFGEAIMAASRYYTRSTSAQFRALYSRVELLQLRAYTLSLGYEAANVVETCAHQATSMENWQRLFLQILDRQRLRIPEVIPDGVVIERDVAVTGGFYASTLGLKQWSYAGSSIGWMDTFLLTIPDSSVPEARPSQGYYWNSSFTSRQNLTVPSMTELRRFLNTEACSVSLSPNPVSNLRVACEGETELLCAQAGCSWDPNADEDRQLAPKYPSCYAPMNLCAGVAGPCVDDCGWTALCCRGDNNVCYGPRIGNCAGGGIASQNTSARVMQLSEYFGVDFSADDQFLTTGSDFGNTYAAYLPEQDITITRCGIQKTSERYLDGQCSGEVAGKYQPLLANIGSRGLLLAVAWSPKTDYGGFPAGLDSQNLTAEAFECGNFADNTDAIACNTARIHRLLDTSLGQVLAYNRTVTEFFRSKYVPAARNALDTTNIAYQKQGFCGANILLKLQVSSNIRQNVTTFSFTLTSADALDAGWTMRLSANRTGEQGTLFGAYGLNVTSGTGSKLVLNQSPLLTEGESFEFGFSSLADPVGLVLGEFRFTYSNATLVAQCVFTNQPLLSVQSVEYGCEDVANTTTSGRRQGEASRLNARLGPLKSIYRLFYRLFAYLGFVRQPITYHVLEAEEEESVEFFLDIREDILEDGSVREYSFLTADFPSESSFIEIETELWAVPRFSFKPDPLFSDPAELYDITGFLVGDAADDGLDLIVKNLDNVRDFTYACKASARQVSGGQQCSFNEIPEENTAQLEAVETLVEVEAGQAAAKGASALARAGGLVGSVASSAAAFAVVELVVDIVKTISYFNGGDPPPAALTQTLHALSQIQGQIYGIQSQLVRVSSQLDALFLRLQQHPFVDLVRGQVSAKASILGALLVDFQLVSQNRQTALLSEAGSAERRRYNVSVTQFLHRYEQNKVESYVCDFFGMIAPGKAVPGCSSVFGGGQSGYIDLAGQYLMSANAFYTNETSFELYGLYANVEMYQQLALYMSSQYEVMNAAAQADVNQSGEEGCSDLTETLNVWYTLWKNVSSVQRSLLPPLIPAGKLIQAQPLATSTVGLKSWSAVGQRLTGWPQPTIVTQHSVDFGTSKQVLTQSGAQTAYYQAGTVLPAGGTIPSAAELRELVWGCASSANLVFIDYWKTRVECAGSPATEQACGQTSGCQWNDNFPSDVPFKAKCHQAASNCAVARGVRTECGSKVDSAQTCHAMGCCWDARDELVVDFSTAYPVPACFAPAAPCGGGASGYSTAERISLFNHLVTNASDIFTEQDVLLTAELERYPWIIVEDDCRIDICGADAAPNSLCIPNEDPIGILLPFGFQVATGDFKVFPDPGTVSSNMTARCPGLTCQECALDLLANTLNSNQNGRLVYYSILTAQYLGSR